MLVVRSSLTEILLEVTNEEIRAIASDTLARMRAKGNILSYKILQIGQNLIVINFIKITLKYYLRHFVIHRI